MNRKIRIAVVLVDRANYGRLKPVMQELQKRSEVDLKVICSGTMLLDRFGKAVEVVAADGFNIDERVYMELDGSVPVTMSKSVGLGILEFSSVLDRISPDFVVLIGDRYEAFAAAIAAVFQNLCLVHLQGGEISGSIDESTRHAITKLAHYHFPSTRRAGEYIERMGEDPKTVFALGCPSADVVADADASALADLIQTQGVGKTIDLKKPYLVVLFHPVTTEFGDSAQQMENVLKATSQTGMQLVVLWPNIDAGSDKVSEAIRRFREHNPTAPLHAYKNFEPETYIPLLKGAACLVGNSSSFIRDASFLGTPVVLVGSRQDGREWSSAVKRVSPVAEEVQAAIQEQMAHGPYPPSSLYGEKGASVKIVDQLVKLKPYRQKILKYPTLT